MAERGVEVHHTTIMRWVHQYSPEIEKEGRRYLRPTDDSWRVDETGSVAKKLNRSPSA